jgi:hypothetical protein
MIAKANKMRQAAVCACTAKFLSLLPQIQEQARFAFRREGGEQREELIAEVVANCWAALVRLVDRGLKTAARRFGVSPGRISQTRRELETAWREFQRNSLRA